MTSGIARLRQLWLSLIPALVLSDVLLSRFGSWHLPIAVLLTLLVGLDGLSAVTPRPQERAPANPLPPVRGRWSALKDLSRRCRATAPVTTASATPSIWSCPWAPLPRTRSGVRCCRTSLTTSHASAPTSSPWLRASFSEFTMLSVTTVVATPGLRSFS